MNETKQPTYYAILTAKVRYDNTISDKAKLIYAELTALSNVNGYAHPSNEFLAELYGVKVNTITRIIKELADKKYINVKIKRTAKGTIRRIYITEEIEEITDNNPPIKNDMSVSKPTYQKCENPPIKNVETHLSKKCSALTMNITSSNITSINTTRECVNEFTITLPLIKKLVVELDLTKMNPETFFYHYESKDFKYGRKKIDNLKMLESILKIWESRELKNNTIEPEPEEWLKEYLTEIKDVGLYDN